ncbi:MAG: hypothetical protein IJ655_01730 [Lachnospiraceae bacterium]|nr:hypothetical protein [Lachnospiraceae bacterium]
MKEMKTKLILGLVLVMMAVGLVGCKEKKREPFTYRAPAKQEADDDKQQESEDLQEIVDFNMEEETIAVMSLDNPSHVVRYRYNLTTKFLNKYGDSTSSVNFVKGMVVELGEVTSASVLSSIQISDKVWDYDKVDNYLIDAASNKLSIGQSDYRILESTKFYSDGNEITLADISPDDVLRVIGLDNNIISVMVTTGHGYLQLRNSEVFIGSMMFVGNGIVATITGDMQIEVPEGTYSITVANNGYGGTGEYTVLRGQVTEIDLNALKGEGPKVCRLKFESSVANVQVYLDDVQVAIGQEMEVKYGRHKLSVQAEGYTSWTKVLVVNSASATVSLDLEDENTTDAATNNSTSNSSDSNSSNNSSGNSSSNSGNTSSSSGNSSNSGANSSADSNTSQLDYLTTIRDMLSTLTK